MAKQRAALSEQPKRYQRATQRKQSSVGQRATRL